MAYSYVPVDRDQQFLLPPDVRDWLPEGHLVWFVIDVVAVMDTSVLHRQHPNNGVGRRAFDPEMMLALLVYSYCLGQRSSRQIERLCEVDSAYRVLCANQTPDHTTIARFRQDHAAAMKELFVEVLMVCHQAGLASVGKVALDGTKMGCAASLSANRRRATIVAAVEEMLADAEAVDAGQQELFGDARGDELPAGLDRHDQDRLDRLRECLAQLDAEAARADASQAAADAKADAEAAAGRRVRGRKRRVPDPVADAEREVVRAKALAEQRRRRRAETETAAAERGRRPGGPPPDYDSKVRAAEAARDTAREAAAAAPPVEAPPETRANTTDPDSRMMKTTRSWVQGYNAQAVVNEHQVVLAAVVTQDHNDVDQFDPMVAATAHNLAAAGITDPIGTVLADAGYCSDHNLTSSGPDRLIATHKRHKQDQALRDLGPTSGPAPEGLSPLDTMNHRLRTPEGTELYAQRGALVEPVFGQIKTNRDCERFTRRGHAAADSEWNLIAACHNLLKVFTSGYQPA